MPVGYLLKKTLAKCFFPVPICLVLLVLGLFFLIFTWRKKTGTGLVALGTLLLFLFSIDYVSTELLRPLEHRYAAHRPQATAPDHPSGIPETEGTEPAAPWICVLGSFWSSDSWRPVNSRVDSAFLYRLVEATRLARIYPDARLVVVIASPGAVEEKQKFLDGWAEIMRVDRERFRLISEVRDTRTEARAIKEITGDERVYLVTSASHMPRAMKIFMARGIPAEPAPCAHRTKPGRPDEFLIGYITPYSTNVQKSEQALYEYMGLTWEWVKGLW